MHAVWLGDKGTSDLVGVFYDDDDDDEPKFSLILVMFALSFCWAYRTR